MTRDAHLEAQVVQVGLGGLVNQDLLWREQKQKGAETFMRLFSAGLTPH